MISPESGSASLARPLEGSTFSHVDSNDGRRWGGAWPGELFILFGSCITLNPTEVSSIVVECIQQLNLSRREEVRISPTLDAPLFGEGSSLDSIGLVSLVLDLEDAFQTLGYELSLSDSRAMSRRHSPYRSVQSLIAFILEMLPEDLNRETVQRPGIHDGRQSSDE